MRSEASPLASDDLVSQLPDGLAIAATGANRAAVLQYQCRVAVRERLDFAYLIDGHDHAPVDADEPVWIEPAGETLQRLANEMRPAADVQRQIVSLAFDPLDAGEVDVSPDVPVS